MRGQCEREALWNEMTGYAEEWPCSLNQRTRRTVKYYSASEQRWIEYFLCASCQDSIREQVESLNPSDRANFRGLFPTEEEAQ